MPFLALTHRGLNEVANDRQNPSAAIWCGSNIITEQEHAAYLKRGVNVTRFSFSLTNATSDLLQRALDTLAEHHPEESVWIEATPLKPTQT